MFLIKKTVFSSKLHCFFCVYLQVDKHTLHDTEFYKFHNVKNNCFTGLYSLCRNNYLCCVF